MKTMIRVAIMFAVIAAGTLPAFAEVVEIRLLESKPAEQAPPQAAGGSAQIPPDAKVVASIEALADAAGAFRAKCMVGGETLRLKGRVTAGSDGKRRVDVEFSHRNASGQQEITTSVVVAAEAQVVIGRLTGSDTTRLTVLTLKPDEEPADDPAE